MNKVIVLFLSLLSTAMMANGPVKVNISESAIQWHATKVTGEHSGTVALKSGELDIQNGVLKGGNFVVDMTSIAVTDLEGEWAQKLEGHLKSDDFFGIEQHPTAALVITEVTPMSNGQYDVSGNMTIKGITHPIAFTTQLNDHNAKAKITIDRSKYNVKYNSGSFFDGLGDKLIYDNFDLEVNLVF